MRQSIFVIWVTVAAVGWANPSLGWAQEGPVASEEELFVETVGADGRKVLRPLELEEEQKPKTQEDEEEWVPELPEAVAPELIGNIQIETPGSKNPLPDPTVTRTVDTPQYQWIQNPPRGGAAGVGMDPPHFPDPAVDPKLPQVYRPATEQLNQPGTGNQTPTSQGAPVPPAVGSER